ELLLLPVWLGENDGRRVAERFQDIQVRLRIALHVFFGREEKHERDTAFLNELPRDDETIAAVIPLPAQDRNGEFIEILKLAFENFGHTHPRVLHENKTRDSVLFSG